MFKRTASLLKERGVAAATLVILADRARANIARMAARTRTAGVRLRPHFKTHQNPVVGDWFRAEGITGITVSSRAMAERFAATGWNDITLAFLVNPAELTPLSELARALQARGGRLGLTVDAPAVAGAAAAAAPDADIWLKIDTGHHRTGLPWNDGAALRAVAGSLGRPPAGLLTHAGHAYGLRDRDALVGLWRRIRDRMGHAATLLDIPGLRVSVGDTPTCSVTGDLSGVDEIRPGNFVFYDLMQLEIGSCSAADLAAAVACPVVGIYPERRQVVVHGGAVHLSKESLSTSGGPVFGRVGVLDPPRILDGAIVTGLSQEHGVITFAPEAFPGATDLAPGDPLLIWPVHSCLAADLLEVRPRPSSLILS